MRFLLSFLLAATLCGTGHAAEVKAFIAEAFRAAMEPIATDYEKASGHKLAISYATAGVLRDRIRKGEPVDVVLLPRSVFDSLVADGKIAADSKAPIAQSLISIAVRAGTTKPDVSTPAALKSTLLASRAIGYSDPARGGAIGIHAAKVVEQLGLTEQLRERTKLSAGPQFHDMLVKGEVDLVFTQPIAAGNYPQIELAGALPAELQDPHTFLYIAGVAAQSSDAAAARTLVDYLASPAAARVISAKGMEPVKK